MDLRDAAAGPTAGHGRSSEGAAVAENLAAPSSGGPATTALSTCRDLYWTRSPRGRMGVGGGGVAARGLANVVEGAFVGWAGEAAAPRVVGSPTRVVFRCPVGGNRGYGPTHSQSPQKHLVGVPHLALYELSAFMIRDRSSTKC
ncbi:hypothetical protein [Micromonospora phaseoli]|uniref:hypothetical protein n=1 Tax=Micromonospora phaseoli TaxID=1144548 RepID=UPI0014755DB1|nr:hypothetical protein [Micromonospora phaseoli]